jgi:hypothetical protein
MELAKDEAAFSRVNLVSAYLRPQDFPNSSLSSQEEHTAQRRLLSYRLLDVSSWRSQEVLASSVEAAPRPTIPDTIKTFVWLSVFTALDAF